MQEHFEPAKIVAQFLKPLGFRKDGTNWFKETDDHHYYLAMYKSSHGGGDRYIDIRASFKGCNEDGLSYKRDWQADIRIHETFDLNGALTYSGEFKNLSDDERSKRLEKAMREIILPMLERFSTLDGIRSFYMSGIEPHLMVYLKGKQRLGIPFTLEKQ